MYLVLGKLDPTTEPWGTRRLRVLVFLVAQCSVAVHVLGGFAYLYCTVLTGLGYVLGWAGSFRPPELPRYPYAHGGGSHPHVLYYYMGASGVGFPSIALMQWSHSRGTASHHGICL